MTILILVLVFTHSPRDGSPVHIVSPEQFTAAEHKHEQERNIAKQEKEKAPPKDTEALRVSMDQLREVLSLLVCYILGKDEAQIAVSLAFLTYIPFLLLMYETRNSQHANSKTRNSQCSLSLSL